MANFVFNVAKGHLGYYHESARLQQPSNAGLVIVVLRAAGLESDATLIDKATLADVLAGTTDEATNSGYTRKTLSGATIPAMVVDNANDRITLDLPDLTWTAVQSGDAWAKLLVCYDANTTSGTDADIVPMTAHDVTFTPDGSDIVVQIADYARVT
jgi:hypothetical protein